jgi:hypothetical protein
MTQVQSGRRTHEHDGEVVVFVVGMRVNRWRAVRSWSAALRAMPRMLAELSREQDRGMLRQSTALGPHGPQVTTYWRSVADLLAYASDGDGEHRPAWRAFNAAARRTPGAVGIWHETYVVPAGAHESIYCDMPLTGLAAATSSVPVASRGDRAGQRLSAGGDVSSPA